MDRKQRLNDNETSLTLALDGRQSRIWTAIPGIVQSVNTSQMTVEVQPAIQGMVEAQDGSIQYVNLPVLVDVPICFSSAGGFILTLPIQKGDEVLIIIASRCIDSWWQNGGVGIPMEMRMHDLSDGFCIPGPKSLPNVISNISTTSAQLRNNAGDTYLEIAANGKVNIVTTAGVTVNGNLSVTGTISATGDVTASNGLISLTNHIHTGVTTGGGTTGPATG